MILASAQRLGGSRSASSATQFWRGSPSAAWACAFRAQGLRAGHAAARGRDTRAPPSRALEGEPVAEALSLVADAEKVPNRTPYENFVLDQLRGGAAAGVGDTATAVKSYEAVWPPTACNRPRRAAGDGRPGRHRRAARTGERVVTWGRRYLEGGGTSPQVRARWSTACTSAATSPRRRARSRC